MHRSQGFAELLFLVRLCVPAVVPGDQHEPTELWVDKFSMAAFSAVDSGEPTALKVGNQLANLAWHTTDPATSSVEFPASILAQLATAPDGAWQCCGFRAGWPAGANPARPADGQAPWTPRAGCAAGSGPFFRVASRFTAAAARRGCAPGSRGEKVEATYRRVPRLAA